MHFFYFSIFRFLTRIRIYINNYKGIDLLLRSHMHEHKIKPLFTDCLQEIETNKVHDIK